MARDLLTEKRVRTAKPPPGKHEMDLADGGGLWLRVREGATASQPVRRVWQFIYTRGGRRKRLGLGAYPDVSIQIARDRASRLREQVLVGMTPIAAPRSGTDPTAPMLPRTVNELATRWERDYLALKHKDKGTHAIAAYRRHVGPLIGGVRLTAVRKLHVLSVIQPIAASGRKRTAAALLGLMRQLFTWGIRHDFLTIDPTAALVKSDFAGRTDPRERVLSSDEIVDLAKRMTAQRRAGPPGRERVWDVVPKPVQAAVWVMLATLARVGELSQARWEHVDEEAGTWIIPADHAKNGLVHVVHLSPFACRHLGYLRSYACGSDWILPDRDGKDHINVQALNKALRDRQRGDGERAHQGRSSQATALLLSGGIFTAHDLRRTGATLMQSLGVEPPIIERCLNHVEPSKLVRTYQRSDMMPERRDAFLRLGSLLDRLVPSEATEHLVIRSLKGCTSMSLSA